MDDRRRHRRFSVRLPAIVYLGVERWTVRGHLTDLSAGGAFLTAPARLEAGDAMHLWLRWRDAQAQARGRDPCSAAVIIATANGATIDSCAVAGRDVRVQVTVVGPHWLGQRHDLSAQARAGPA